MGEVLSSQDYVYDNPMQLDALPGSFTYSTDRKARGDLFDIHYVHIVDYVHEVPVKVQIQQPAMKILRADGQANKIVKSGSPVLLIVNGEMSITMSELHVVSGNAFDGPIAIEHRDHSTARAKDFG
ncbi:hypothetical protein AA0120_g3299 [Alternaria tenuissima]|nr:hypothetical protein AA0120_g3299 [Alternaria tenuissima]